MQQKSLSYQVFNIFENYGKLILACVFILTLAAGYYFFIKPSYDKMTFENNQKIQDLDMSITRASNYKSMLESFLSKYSSMDSNEIDRIAKMLPTDDNYAALPPHIEYLVLRKGYVLKNIQVDRQDAATDDKIAKQLKNQGAAGMRVGELIKEHLGIMKIQFSAYGANYDGFKSLLKDLENNLRLMDVEQLTFDPSSKGSQFKITAYYWK